MFKYLKMSNLTQTLLKKKHTPTKYVFFGNNGFRCLNIKNYCLESPTKQALMFPPNSTSRICTTDALKCIFHYMYNRPWTQTGGKLQLKYIFHFNQ